MMKDPDSFVLEGAYLLKPDKKGHSEVCYYYRARNSYGAYNGNGEALLLKNDRLFLIDDDTRSNPFFGLVDSCRAKNRIADITVDVLGTLNPSQITAALIRSRADQQKMVEAQNASFKKESVAGYAEIKDDDYIVHSERATFNKVSREYPRRQRIHGRSTKSGDCDFHLHQRLRPEICV